MNQSTKNSQAQVQSDRLIRTVIRSASVRIIFGSILFLFFFRLFVWILVSIFYPASTNLALHAVHIDHAIRNEYPMEKLWFITPGFIAIVRILNFVPFEYRTMAVHLLDDSLLICFFVITGVWSRRVFSTSWPSVIGVTYLVSRLLETRFVELSDRDWYAAMFSFAAMLVAGSSESKRSAVLGGTLWMIGLQFRPQTVLLLPCLALARLSQCRSERLGFGDFRKAFVQTAFGLAVGFVLVNIPVWIMGGFPAYYRDTFLFAKQGGHDGKTSPGLIPRNFAWLVLRRQDFPLSLILPMLLILCIREASSRRQRIWLVAILYTLPASFLWASVNLRPVRYHEFPIFIAEAIALGAITGFVMTLRPNRTDPILLLSIVLCFSIGFYSDPLIDVKGSVRQAFGKIRSLDWSPICVSSKSYNAFPPEEWSMNKVAARELYNFLGSKVDSNKIPFEKIDMRLETFQSHFYFLRNPGVIGDGTSWDSLLTTIVHTDGKESFEKFFVKYLDSLKSTPDAYILWIPSQANAADYRIFDTDISTEARMIFETIRTHYEPLARFGKVEIRRKRPAGGTAKP